MQPCISPITNLRCSAMEVFQYMGGSFFVVCDISFADPGSTIPFTGYIRDTTERRSEIIFAFYAVRPTFTNQIPGLPEPFIVGAEDHGNTEGCRFKDVVYA